MPAGSRQGGGIAPFTLIVLALLQCLHGATDALQARLPPPPGSEVRGMNTGDAFTRGLLRQRGAVLLFALVWVAILPLLLLSTVDLWQTRLQRERETELLFIGREFARALASYQAADRSGESPATLAVLLRDRRSLVEQHHLRRLYRDPMTHSTDWGLVYGPDKRIEGVYSRSDAEPMKQTGFPEALKAFEKKKTYREWVFTAQQAGAQTD
jgi:hypothetical protein